jgi:hypothetical protein
LLQEDPEASKSAIIPYHGNGTFIILSTFLLFYFLWRPESSDHIEASRFALHPIAFINTAALYPIGPEYHATAQLLGPIPGHKAIIHDRHLVTRAEGKPRFHRPIIPSAFTIHLASPHGKCWTLYRKKDIFSIA